MSLITTSRRPTIQARILIRDLSLLIPGGLRVNRGKTSFNGLLVKSLENGRYCLIIVDSEGNKPSSINIFKLDDGCKILSKHKLKIHRLIDKTDISNLRVPVKANRYFTVDEGMRPEMLEGINTITENIGLKRIGYNQLKDTSGIIFYFKSENSSSVLSFHIAPSMVEIGPRIYIKQILSGD